MQTKTRGENIIEARIIVATGTPWERAFDLGRISYGTPPRKWHKRMLWSLSRWARRKQRRLVERQIASYRAKIARAGYTDNNIAERIRSEMASATKGAEN